MGPIIITLPFNDVDRGENAKFSLRGNPQQPSYAFKVVKNVLRERYFSFKKKLIPEENVKNVASLLRHNCVQHRLPNNFQKIGIGGNESSVERALPLSLPERSFFHALFIANRLDYTTAWFHFTVVDISVARWQSIEPRAKRVNNYGTFRKWPKIGSLNG